MHLISRFRNDADLMYLYYGESTGKIGRPKKYAEKLQHTIAHELGHGAFTLYHTFSSKDKSIPEGSTYNLMDYPPVGGQVLLKPQTICNANINQYFVKLCQSLNLQMPNLLIIS